MIRSISPFLALTYSHDYVHIYVRKEETKSSGWAEHNDKGKKDVIFVGAVTGKRKSNWG